MELREIATPPLSPSTARRSRRKLSDVLMPVETHALGVARAKRRGARSLRKVLERKEMALMSLAEEAARRRDSGLTAAAQMEGIRAQFRRRRHVRVLHAPKRNSSRSTTARAASSHHNESRANAARGNNVSQVRLVRLRHQPAARAGRQEGGLPLRPRLQAAEAASRSRPPPDAAEAAEAGARGARAQAAAASRCGRARRLSSRSRRRCRPASSSSCVGASGASGTGGLAPALRPRPRPLFAWSVVFEKVYGVHTCWVFTPVPR